MADKQSEFLILSLQDLNRMKLEFVESYDKLMQDSALNLQKTLMIKINSLQVCQNQRDD